jgi:hypothetical protein
VRAAALSLLFAGCAHAAPAPASTRPCLGQAALAGAADHLAAGMGAVKKLDPELRSLLRAMVEAGKAGVAVDNRGRCFPESVGLIVALRGPRADLEAVGFEVHSLGPHPDGTLSGTGRISTLRLLDLAAVDSLVAADGGGHYLPE